MRRLAHIWMSIAALLAGCSLYLPIRVKNTSDAPITLTYKIQPLGLTGLLDESAAILGETAMDTVKASVSMNRADSTITLTLLPGEKAILGAGRTSRKDQLLSNGEAAKCGQYERDCMNLYWMRISQNGVERTYTSEELLKALRKRSIPITLVPGENKK